VTFASRADAAAGNATAIGAASIRSASPGFTGAALYSL